MKAINVKGSNFDFENCTNGGDGHARHHDSTPPTEPYPHFYTKKGGESDSPDALCPAGGGVLGTSRRRGHPLTPFTLCRRQLGEIHSCPSRLEPAVDTIHYPSLADGFLASTNPVVKPAILLLLFGLRNVAGRCFHCLRGSLLQRPTNEYLQKRIQNLLPFQLEIQFLSILVGGSGLKQQERPPSVARFE